MAFKSQMGSSCSTWQVWGLSIALSPVWSNFTTLQQQLVHHSQIEPSKSQLHTQSNGKAILRQDKVGLIVRKLQQGRDLERISTLRQDRFSPYPGNQKSMSFQIIVNRVHRMAQLQTSLLLKNKKKQQLTLSMLKRMKTIICWQIWLGFDKLNYHFKFSNLNNL